MSRAIHSIAVAVALTAMAGCGGSVRRPDGGEGLLATGAPAPDFAAVDAAGNPVQLTSSRGAPTVVFFYPKDESPGCTKEACAFRDAWDKLGAAKVTVFGISRDSAESHALFREKYHLPFPLAADSNGVALYDFPEPHDRHNWERLYDRWAEVPDERVTEMEFAVAANMC